MSWPPGGVIPVPFDEYMAAALYDPAHGFYTAHGGVAGRRGDFLTSVEVGPLFGAVVARWLDERWRELGRPDPFRVLDAGAGPGTWLRTIMVASPACARALQATLAEPSPAARARHDPTVRSIAGIDELDAPVHVVLANELLDNLPVRIVRPAGADGGWLELWVAGGAEQWRPGRVIAAGPAAALARLADGDVYVDRYVPTAPLDGRLPVAEAAAAWIGQARGCLVAGGWLLTFDYGRTSSSAFRSRPWVDWLRTYRQHGRGVSPLEEPGTQDVTCEVPFDQLPAAAVLECQADWLRRHGIDELVAEGRRVWRERAAIGDLAALRARSRVREAEALLDPTGLGAFLVAEWAASERA